MRLNLVARPLAKALLWLIAVLAVATLFTAHTHAESITIPVTQDTWINSGSDSTWGDWDYFKVGSDDYSGNQRGLLKSDLSQVPASVFIESARLEVYYSMSSASSTDGMPISVHRMTSDWDEATAAWPLLGNSADQFAYDSQTLGAEYSDGRKWVSWNVTQLVREWLTGKYPNYGVALIGHEGPPEDYRYFSAREKGAGWEARLIVEWSRPATAPTPTLTVSPTPTQTPRPDKLVVNVGQDTWINSASSNNWALTRIRESVRMTLVGISARCCSSNFQSHRSALASGRLPCRSTIAMAVQAARGTWISPSIV